MEKINTSVAMQRSRSLFLFVTLVTIGCLALLFVNSVSADNGPHGEYTATTDTCAGCHRAHTAASDDLLLSTIPSLCYTCHGSSATGADTNVVDGKYDGLESGSGEGIVNRALKGGGVQNALMDTDVLTTTMAIITQTTSSHIVDGSLSTLWGNGALTDTVYAGLTGFSLSCVTCHDPHGGGNYRVLRSMPVGSGANSAITITDEVTKTYTVESVFNSYMGEHYGPQSSNLSNWCSQCHTRYMAPGDGGHTDSSDPVFAFRHDTTDAAGCLTCHVAHGTTAKMGTYSGSVKWPDESTAPNGDGRSSLLRLDNRGVCASCHVNEGGNVGGGSCTGCHSQPQGGSPEWNPGGNSLQNAPLQGSRRAVIGEFPVGDSHAHFGNQLDAADCAVCHDQATHADGFIDLYDPDGLDGATNGVGYRFQQTTDAELASDPDLSNFCADCHDADGAKRMNSPLDPFGVGNQPPDAKTKFQGTLQWDEWYGDFCFGTEGTLREVNSHHDISDADQAASGAKLECLNCHGAHTSGSTQKVSNPTNNNAPWSGTDNEFCLSCHDGGAGPGDPGLPSGALGPAIAMRGIDSCDYVSSPWYVDYSWTNAAHGQDSKRGWNGYSGAPAAEVECLTCHDSHGSFTLLNTVGNPYMIRDTVDGTPYIDDGIRTGSWFGPPWETTGTVKNDVAVTISGTDVGWASLCETCHADWLAAYDWHSYCTGCQTCHGHGQAWQNHDWVDGDGSTPCPAPASPNTLPRLESLWEDLLSTGAGPVEPGEGSSYDHDTFDPGTDSCRDCHVANLGQLGNRE